MKVCPNNKTHKQFFTTAVEVHEWVVDENGGFIQDLGCSQMYAYPDTNNVWVCAICGAGAEDEE